jgi:hypothetical protein
MVAGNVIWVAANFAHLAMAWTPLTNLGAPMVVVQALGVATLAELDWSGVRRA